MRECGRCHALGGPCHRHRWKETGRVCPCGRVRLEARQTLGAASFRCEDCGVTRIPGWGWLNARQLLWVAALGNEVACATLNLTSDEAEVLFMRSKNAARLPS